MTSAAPREGRMPAAERRDQLLDVLARLILDEGYASVSIDRVAREAGIARTVVYAQFDNLDGLHTALADRNEQRIFQQVSGVLPDIAGDEADIRTGDWARTASSLRSRSAAYTARARRRRCPA